MKLEDQSSSSPLIRTASGKEHEQRRLDMQLELDKNVETYFMNEESSSQLNILVDSQSSECLFSSGRNGPKV